MKAINPVSRITKTPQNRLLLVHAMLVAILMPFNQVNAQDNHNASASVPPPRDLQLVTADRVEIAATHYAPASQKPAPGVLLVHMCLADTNRDSWAKLARMLAKAGIHALAVDLRGYGESAGGEPPFTNMANFITFWRSTGMNDLEAGINYLRTLPDADMNRMGVAGASCGVFMSIELARRHQDIRAMALLSGPFDGTAAEHLATLSDVPVVGAASEDDGAAYLAMQRVFATTTHPASRNLQFKGDAHGTNMFHAQPDLERQVTDWFIRWLKP